jgi:hypothetical protein
VSAFVAYRKPIPDEETVMAVKKELRKNNIEYSQLVNWRINCTFADSSNEDEDSQ